MIEFQSECGLLLKQSKSIKMLMTCKKEFLLARAKRRILVEGNAIAQFGRLLALHAGADMAARILRCDGLPFAADETAERPREVLDREALQ